MHSVRSNAAASEGDVVSSEVFGLRRSRLIAVVLRRRGAVFLGRAARRPGARRRSRRTLISTALTVSAPTTAATATTAT